MHTKERRLAKIVVPNENLIQMMFTNYSARLKTIQGLPEGAVFISAINDAETGDCWFIFYHPSFQEVPLKNVIPEIPWRLSNAY